MSKRVVYYISDGTGITAKAFGRSLLTQFEDVQVTDVTIPYIDTLEKAEDAIRQINESYQQTGQKPLIFATIVDREIHDKLNESHGLLLDFFHRFIGPLEKELKIHSSHTIGKTHGVQDAKEYISRIAAVNYTLSSDDGSNIKNYQQADFILIGVSRCGKTPTSLYMALQFGIKVANYPFTIDDMQRFQLPDFLAKHKNKLFGLTIDPRRLHTIRSERRPNSQYADLAQCRLEVDKVETLFRKEKIPFINTTTRSIEEISTTIVNSKNNGAKSF